MCDSVIYAIKTKFAFECMEYDDPSEYFWNGNIKYFRNNSKMRNLNNEKHKNHTVATATQIYLFPQNYYLKISHKKRGMQSAQHNSASPENSNCLIRLQS